MGDEEIKKISEDMYAAVDFDEDTENVDESKGAEFDDIEPVKFDISPDEILNRLPVFSDDNKLVSEKIIVKASGHTLEIKYDFLGQKESVREFDKNGLLVKATDYYANGQPKQTSDYGKNGAYKTLSFNIDGSRISFAQKYEDGLADAICYDVDKKGSKLAIKFDKDKNVLEQKLID